MFRRWLKNLSMSVPTVDLSDLSNELSQLNAKKRQFAPELSQTIYNFMITKSYAIGDFTSELSSKVSRQDRANMVNLIEQIHAVKEYRTETLYLAVSLMDKYLANLTLEYKRPPCLITLSVTCLLMAAKLAQPISPSFTRLISLLRQQSITHIEKQHIIDLEESIIRRLDYNL